MDMPNSSLEMQLDPQQEETLLGQIKQIINRREYNALESLMLDYVTKNHSVSNLSEVWGAIDYLNRPQMRLSPYVQSIVLTITEYLINNNYNNEALEHIRHTAKLLNPDRKLTQKITALYKYVYPNNKNLDVLIRLFQIEESTPLSEAIMNLDKFLAFDIGNPVFSSRFGYGVVTKIDFVLDTITINFFAPPSVSGSGFSSQNQTFTFDQALKSLQALPKDNFYYIKEKQVSVLIQLITKNPAELLKITKRDLPENIKNADIRKTLESVVSSELIEQFIEYIKKLRVNAKPKIKKQEDNNVSIDDTEILSLTEDKIIESLNAVFGNSKMKFLLVLKEKRKDWHELSINLFFTQFDKRVLETIFSELNSKEQRNIIDKTFIEYKRHPIQFLYLAEKLNEDPYAILTRYLDLVHLSGIKLEKSSLASEIRKRLIKDNYELIRKTVSEITSDLAERILTRIEDMKNLYPEERDASKDIIKQQFPELSESIASGHDEFIYSTEVSIRNKTVELHKLVNEEIPKVASEIAQARSFGDLRENFEYKAAKEKQKRLMHKVTEMRHELSIVKPINFTKIDASKVNIGTTVKLISVNDAQSAIGGLTYTILGIWDSNVQKGIISYLAPFAKNLLNKVVGEEVSDSEGKMYKITEINKAQSK
jgi:transcription elongation GreA/GreB family factor